MRYLPSTAADEQRLLAAIGRERVADLFSTIPENLRAGDMEVPGPRSEAEIRERFQELAHANAQPSDYAWFLGAGAYRHEVSCIVDHVLARAEFATAYTPYQPEIAQGTLQAIFEFQSLICQLTGCDVANASLYDGASAVAEAALLALRVLAGRKTVVVARSLHPHHRAVLDTYGRHLGIVFRDAPPTADGRVDADAVSTLVTAEVAAVIVQSPNFFGVIEDVAAIAARAHDRGALMVVSVPEPASLGVLAPPGGRGADIVVGDAASFAGGPSYGGPYVGFFATSQKFVRNMPGRLCGQTVDRDGKRGFVLTLATREQHIRRERATSNICTNQGLVMLAATVGMCLYGKNGLRQMAIANLTLAEEAKRRIRALPGYTLPFSGPTFNEFVVEGPRPAAEVLAALRTAGIVAGPDLATYYPDRQHAFLVTVTERNKLAEIERLVSVLGSVAGGAR